MADTYWGRFKTINVAIGIAIFGHVIIITSSVPGVIEHSSTAIGVFCVGLIFFGIGVGFFSESLPRFGLVGQELACATGA